MGKKSSSTKRAPKAKDNGRRFKKKISILDSEKIDYVDWKDVDLLRRFMSDRAKIRARRINGNDEQQQKEISRAIKNAREMALLPYSSRVTTQRGGKGDRRGRGDRRDRPPRDDDRASFEDDSEPRDRPGDDASVGAASDGPTAATTTEETES